MKRRLHLLLLAAFLAFLLEPTLAFARRSGGSFGGRAGFRSGGSSFSRSPSVRRNTYGGGPNVVILPGFGWGWGMGPFGLGGGNLFGTLLMMTVVGLGTVAIIRAVRRARVPETESGDSWSGEQAVAAPGRTYVYRLQLGLGRSARDIRNRLAHFAEGDTATETGLAQLLQQTVLELMREKDSIRYAAIEASGPMNLANGETKLTGAALSERSRFQIERVRGADGKVRRSEVEPIESMEALEYLVVTLLVATRVPLGIPKAITSHEELDATLYGFGGLAPRGLLGMEVIWTPADAEDSLTQTDLLTSYPDMRSV